MVDESFIGYEIYVSFDYDYGDRDTVNVWCQGKVLWWRLNGRNNSLVTVTIKHREKSCL